MKVGALCNKSFVVEITNSLLATAFTQNLLMNQGYCSNFAGFRASLPWIKHFAVEMSWYQ